MIERVADLRRVAVHDSGGRIGFVEQVFFDDRHWAIRFLVVDAGPERGDRRLLIPPGEASLRAAGGRAPAAYSPVRALEAPARPAGGSRKAGEGQLRSSREWTGSRVTARDGRIGHVEDLLYDGASWSIRFVLVDARNWIDGDWLLVPPLLVRAMDRGTRTLALDTSVSAVRTARPVEGVRHHLHSSADADPGGPPLCLQTGSPSPCSAEGRELPWKR